MLKLGIIGWGYWGRNYAKYFDNGLDAELTTVCDLRPEMLADAKRLYPHLKVTREMKDILREKPDGVIIASPTSIHYKLSLPFIDAGIPLLIEKPLTNSLETSKQLERRAHEKKSKVLVGHTFLYNQAVRFIKMEVDAKKFGKLYYLEFRRQSYGPIRDDVNIIWDFAPHDIAITNYLLNSYPIRVDAKGGRFSRHDQEDIAVMTLRYPGNVLVNINVAWLYPVKIRSLTLVGDKKMAIFEDTNSSAPLHIYDTSLHYPKENEPFGASFRLGDVLMPRLKTIDPLQTQLQHFVAYIQGREKPLTPISDGVAVVRVLDALQKSLQSGREIAV